MKSFSDGEMGWGEALRLCGFSDSEVAKSLMDKVKKRRKLTSRQIECIYTYAHKMKKQVTDSGPVVLNGSESYFPLTVNNLTSSYTLELKPKGHIVEISTGRVVGRLQGNQIVLYPNPLVPSSAVRAAIKRNGCGLRHVELVRPEGQAPGQGHTV